MNIFQKIINRFFHKEQLYSTIVDGNGIVGYIYTPRYTNGKGIVYCHGGFIKAEKEDYEDWPDVMNYITGGYCIMVIKFEDEYVAGKKYDLLSDVKECLDAGTVLSKTRNFRQIFLAGVSRGAFVALNTFARDTTKIFKKCVSISGPTRKETFKETVFFKTGLPKDAQDYFLTYDDPYTLSTSYNPATLLLIHGQNDPIVPVDQALDLFHKIGCFIKVLPNEDHSVFKSCKADEYAEEFLDS